MDYNTKISKKKKFEDNPRRITKEQFEKLQQSIEELGDLSGVVYCHNHKSYLGGNQRSEIFDGAEIEILKKYDPPTIAHTVAEGYIIHNGERFAYREVLFSDREFDKATIVANNAGGKNDYDILANNYDLDDLLDWGVDMPFDFEEEEEEPREPKPDETGMLAITLTDDEAAIWGEIKQELKSKKDKPAFLKLMEEYKNLKYAKDSE